VNVQQPPETDIDRLLAGLQTADYSLPENADSCDLLMKGGVTSGVVYPTTICRLAQTFRLRNIGGTSAGALASVLAAAAEYERTAAMQAPRAPAGFNRLANVPAFLGSGRNLLDLFQPSKSTAPLFRIFLTLIDSEKSWFVKALSPFRHHLLATLVAAVAAAVFYALNVGILVPSWSSVSGLAQVLALVAALVVFILVAVVLIGASLVRIILKKIPDNEFGMCTGLKTPGPASPLPLTPWLADRIDHVAGRSDVEVLPSGAKLAPLTFGDLYKIGRADPPEYPYPDEPESPVLEDLNDRATRAVNLEMVTTDVTAGRPHRLPFNPRGTTRFYFDPDELRDFFPPRVLDEMMKEADDADNAPLKVAVMTLAPPKRSRSSADPAPDPVPQKAQKKQTLYPFPSAEHLPLVVAARMSMSFPILFSAVPLYAVDREAQRRQHAGAPGDLEVRKTWFSDGGLSSNIPVHFFDGPIPRWPTFALNLRGFPRTADGLEQPLDPNAPNDKKVFLATEYDPDVELFFEKGRGRLFQFVNSILDAMQNWNDNTLMQLPGYRERTVEIAMRSSEGGLNLVMPKATIDSIMERGFHAADRFKEKFATPTLNDSAYWNNHRHIRLRSSLLMQSEWTRRFRMAWDTPTLRPPYADVVGGGNPPYENAYDPSEIPSAKDFAVHLRDAPDKIQATLTKQPHPAPELRARPRV
jgi:predicted acylesterase/phospholipase RssA